MFGLIEQNNIAAALHQHEQQLNWNNKSRLEQKEQNKNIGKQLRKKSSKPADESNAIQSQKTVAAYFTSKQLLPFGFAVVVLWREIGQSLQVKLGCLGTASRSPGVRLVSARVPPSTWSHAESLLKVT